MSKKYKNTKHKNPFREDRPRKPFPWLTFTFIVLFVTAAVLCSVLVYNTFGSGVRKFTTDAPGSTAYDKRSGVTYYYQATSPYYAAGDLEEYAICGDYTFYKIKGIDPKIMLHSTIKDGDDQLEYGLYCIDGYEFPDPQELVISAGRILQTDLETIPLASLDKESSVEIMTAFLNGEKSEYPIDIDVDSIYDVYLYSDNYTYLRYTMRYFKTKSGERYLSSRESGIYIKLAADELKDIFPEEE